MCGSRTYGRWDQSVPDLSLDLAGLPRAGSKVTFNLRGADASSNYLMLVGLKPTSFPFDPLGIQMHIDGTILTALYIPSDTSGNATVPAPILNDPRLEGFHMTFQALAMRDKVLRASNGLELRFCR